MKKANFIFWSIIFLSPFCLLAQESASFPTREISRADMLAIRWGQIERFDYLQQRFEEAWTENDLQSMEDIRMEMLKGMKMEREQFDQRFVQKKKTKAQAKRGGWMERYAEAFQQFDLAELFKKPSCQESKVEYDRLSALLSQYREQIVEEFDEISGSDLESAQ